MTKSRRQLELGVPALAASASSPADSAAPAGSAALYATVADVAATHCTIHVWNAAGADIGGAVNWTATGE